MQMSVFYRSWAGSRVRVREGACVEGGLGSLAGFFSEEERSIDKLCEL